MWVRWMTAESKRKDKPGKKIRTLWMFLFQLSLNLYTDECDSLLKEDHKYALCCNQDSRK